MTAPNYSPPGGKIGTRVTNGGVIYEYRANGWVPIASAAKKTTPAFQPVGNIGIGTSGENGNFSGGRTAPMSVPTKKYAPMSIPTPTSIKSAPMSRFESPKTSQSTPQISRVPFQTSTALQFRPQSFDKQNFSLNQPSFFQSALERTNPFNRIDPAIRGDQGSFDWNRALQKLGYQTSSSSQYEDPSKKPTPFSPNNTAEQNLYTTSNNKITQLNNDIDTRNAALNQNGEDIFGVLGSLGEGEFASEEEYFNRLKDDAKRQYDLLNERARSQDPIIRAETEKQLAKLAQDYADFEKQANDLKAETLNNAGQAIKQNVLNTNESKNKLANVFTSLGSADSSQFAEQLAGILGASGDYSGDVTRTANKSVADIGNTLLKYRGQTDESKAGLIAKRDELLRAIQDQLAQNDLSSAQAITNILGQKVNMDYDRQAKQQALRDQALLNQQNNAYALQQLGFANQLKNSTLFETPNYKGMIPTVLADELNQFDQLQGWGPVQAARAKELLRTYPTYADLINEIVQRNQ